MKRIITVAAGLRSARFFGGLEDLLMQIDACDPDVIDLRKLGGVGRWLGAKCGPRFPGRKVLASSGSSMDDERTVPWRTYDPTALVSIVLPTYNSEKYLNRAIESLLKQTHTNFELIVVDDNSVDATPAIIRKYAALDRRIRLVIRSQPKPGLPESLNLGFSSAKGRYLTWFQSDNLYTANAVEYMVQQLCTFPKVGFVYCSTYRIDEADDPSTAYYFDATLPATALARHTVISGPFMYRREVMELVGPYRPECRYFEDLDFFIRACQKFPSKFYFEPCHFYRRHGGSLTSAQSADGRNWKIWHRKMRAEHFASGDRQIIVPNVDQLLPNALSEAPDLR
jgi:glycosyltransferase involved in cell wall biosynthesis